MERRARAPVGEWHRQHDSQRGDEIPVRSTNGRSALAPANVRGDGIRRLLLEIDEERWTFAVIDGKAHLLRLTEQATLETRFLGHLFGGEYREEIGADGIRVTFQHTKLPVPLTLEAEHPAAGLATIRGVLRQWAEAPAASSPN